MIVLFGTPLGAEILWVTRGRPIIFVDICLHHTTNLLKSAAISKERLWYICKRCLLVYIQSAPSKGWPLNKTRCCAIRIEADAVHCQSNTEQQNVAAPELTLINPTCNVNLSCLKTCEIFHYKNTNSDSNTCNDKRNVHWQLSFCISPAHLQLAGVNTVFMYIRAYYTP